MRRRTPFDRGEDDDDGGDGEDDGEDDEDGDDDDARDRSFFKMHMHFDPGAPPPFALKFSYPNS